MDDGYNPANTQTGGPRARPAGQGLRDPQRPRHPDPHRRARLPQDQPVPDLFVASGSRSWNQPDKYPDTFGSNPDYTVEGKILGQLRQGRTSPARRSASRPGRRLRRATPRRPREGARRERASPKQTYVTTQHQRRPADRRAQGGRLRGRRCWPPCPASPRWPSAPPRSSASSRSGWSPASAPTTPPLARPLGAGQRRCWRACSPPTTCRCDRRPTNPWIQLFKKINDEYNGNAPFDGNIVYGMAVGYLFVQALQAGRQGPDPRRRSSRRSRRAA